MLYAYSYERFRSGSLTKLAQASVDSVVVEALHAQRTSQWLGSSLANNPSPLSKLSLNRTHSSNFRAASSFRSPAASSASSAWSCRDNDRRCRGIPSPPRCSDMLLLLPPLLLPPLLLLLLLHLSA